MNEDREPAAEPAAVETPIAGHEPATSTTTLPLPPPPPSPLLPPSPVSRSWLSSVRRPRTSPGPKTSALKRTRLADDDDRRDSALAASNSTPNPTDSLPCSLRRTPSLPAIVVHDASKPGPGALGGPDRPHATFAAIDTIIPTGSFDDLTSDTQVSFSKRGSMMLGGKKANRGSRPIDLPAEGASPPDTPASLPHAPSSSPPGAQQDLAPPTVQLLTPRTPSRYSARSRAASQRVLSTDEMTLSRKVRTMYQHGNESAVNWDMPEEDMSSARSSLVGSSNVTDTTAATCALTINVHKEDASSLYSSQRTSIISKEPTEAAGGLEDWADLEGGEVDRYGFIIPAKVRRANRASGDGLEGPDDPQIQRVTSTLQLVSNQPRHRAFGRSASRARSAAPHSPSPQRHVSQKHLRQAKSSIFSNHTSATRNTHRSIRNATNILPHNRDRRLRDKASDMLKLPPGLAEVAEQQEGGRAALAMKAKEIERNDKWRKMAKVVQAGADKGGMLFEFDTRDPKLISRTWKGIPDRWRATAWYSFLAASAKAVDGSPSEEELITSFYELQAEGSAEDVQIDVDVPRTINRHIMFRRRYRGGLVSCTQTRRAKQR